MKKWLIFCGGMVIGAVLTILLLVLFASRSQSNDGTTFFEKPGDEVTVKSFKVFQVLGKDAALVHGVTNEEYEIFSGAVYLLTNEDGKYYYDDEIVKVPEGKVVRQVGIYRYKTQSEFEKTVPIIQILDN